MKHPITIDGQQREIDIRPMDEDFIVYRKMYAPPLTRDNIGRINGAVRRIESINL
jgi:hypothetical protein